VGQQRRHVLYPRDPQASQIGITNCAASLTDGFPPLTFVPVAQGGCPPFGSDFNGILRQITQWSQWMQAFSGCPTTPRFRPRSAAT